MKIDSNGIIGRFGIVSKGVNDLDEFIGELDQHNIEKCLVSSTMSFLHDTAKGNETAWQWCEKSKGRLISIPLINPRWGIEEAEKQIKLGAKALKLSPCFHRFSLNDKWLFGELENFLATNKVPLFIDTGLACSADMYKTTAFSQIVSFCERYKAAPVVILGLSGIETEGMTNFLKNNPNIYLETSYLYTAGYIKRVVEAGLEEQIVAGSGYGVNTISAGWSVVKHAEISIQAKNKIAGENIAGIIKIN